MEIEMKLLQRKTPIKKNFLSFAVIALGLIFLYSQLSKRGYFPPLSYWGDILCLQRCDEQGSALHVPPPGDRLLKSTIPLNEILALENIDKSQVSIFIEKSKYRLTVYYHKKPVKSYPVVFGENPADDKLREGDMRTPEGIFKIRDSYPHPEWSKFIWIDYPTKTSWRKHVNAKLQGKINWWDTVGSEVGIHGVPKGADNLIAQRSNWTWGCISLTTKDIDELYQVVQVGTEVEIVR